ncbi:hypothetical protein TPA0910_04030 [Streptomyces hygroscopicus subsp. sporocinereus]|uniref:XdhC- CoxI domain-containing protein n=1 Tax=Streptomyces hygroscopicus TaxID=1912 RepID=A0ABQ3TRK4_STRHY|nr:hypothetical protein TPA0910_04030 [Streptomyces hygroscopicus]
MRDVLEPLGSWWAEGKASALATVVATHRSAPRRPGASMLVGPGGEAVGSISGGCVESARECPGAPRVRQCPGVPRCSESAPVPGSAPVPAPLSPGVNPACLSRFHD